MGLFSGLNLVFNFFLVQNCIELEYGLFSAQLLDYLDQI